MLNIDVDGPVDFFTTIGQQETSAWFEVWSVTSRKHDISSAAKPFAMIEGSVSKLPMMRVGPVARYTTLVARVSMVMPGSITSVPSTVNPTLCNTPST
jgi:hypothetical protein